MLKILLQKGLVYVLGTSFVNKIIAFVTNIFIVRILDKESYGIYTSAFNVYSIVCLFSSLGVTSGILFFCSDTQEKTKRHSYYKYAYKIGMITNTISCIFLIIYGVVSPFGIEKAKSYVVLLSLLPICGFYYNYYTIVLRTRKDNKKYSLLLNINSSSYFVFAVIGSLIGGIIGTITGRYFSYIVTGTIGAIFCGKYLKVPENTRKILSKNERKEFLMYSIPCCLTSALNNLLYLLDVAVINVVVQDAVSLASYKTATVIPENLVFIPEAIILVAFPYFVEHKDDACWLSENIKKLVLVMAAVGLTISVSLVCLAPWIIKIVWGNQYLDSVLYFRILSISVFFLCLRATSTNILACIGKVKFNLYVGIFTGFTNIVLDYFLITKIGTVGAALATVLVALIASLLSFPYLIYYVHDLRKK